MSKKISVIVPVCNVEKYLKQCLESILAEPIEELEVICVNDGSTDGSLAIMQQLQKQDNRLVIIDKANSGYGDSMNQGIHASTGEYLAFVESDDMVVPGKLALLAQLAEYVDADVVKGNYYLYTSDEDNVFFENLCGCKYGELINPKVEENIFFKAPSIWSAIYRKDFIGRNEIAFLPTPGASYQDTSFAFKVWASAERVLLVRDAIIYYRQDNMASSSNNTKKLFEIFNETTEMTSFLQRTGRSELLPLCMRVKFESYAWTLNRLAVEEKVKFLMKVFFDVRVDFYQGNLIRKYWEDENWNIIFNLIYDFVGVCSNVLGEVAEKETEVVYSALQKIKKVYIWDETDQEVKLEDKLAEKNILVEAYICSDGNGNLIKIEDGVTTEFTPNDKEKLIVLRASRANEGEIVRTLLGKFLCNYIEIDC